MRTYCLTTTLLLCLLSFIPARSQESLVGDIDRDLLTKYIALARQNFPRVKSFHAREEKARSMVTTAQMSWFDMFNAGYYYRPETSTGSGTTTGGGVTPNGQLITSGFLFGATINLGSLLSKPSLVKAAKADYKAAVADNAEYDIMLANDVRSRYYDYLAARKQLVIRNLSAQNLKGIANDAQAKYEKGSIPLDVYTISKNAATEAAAQALGAEVTYLKAKDALEDLIGAKLETVK
ncbi:TolC family protein [Niabella soli]|uniref:Membrane protein n=1 Tax=Niabella soli DSM 19437 TaxID=929713 RepID=W0EY83_9BACT|nr:TolC family protein [Niabella soli]AHF14154.1 membrane protein [Niabella soli DSM 19437]